MYAAFTAHPYYIVIKLFHIFHFGCLCSIRSILAPPGQAYLLHTAGYVERRVVYSTFHLCVRVRARALFFHTGELVSTKHKKNHSYEIVSVSLCLINIYEIVCLV